MWVKHQPVLAMALRTGSFELGLRRSEMIRLTYDAGEMSLVPRYFEKWFRTDDLHYLSVGISDAALTAAADGTSGEVELRRADNLSDPRLRALVEAVNAEIAGFPSGMLFLDSVEQALAVALVRDLTQWVNSGRSIELKQRFYKAIADGLHEGVKLRREDVFINLVEVPKENWSFGNGEAQYASSSR
jgi:phenylpyruvate tautomerase PptA (4-oxalocrotonate tautomerase family)